MINVLFSKPPPIADIEKYETKQLFIQMTGTQLQLAIYGACGYHD